MSDDFSVEDLSNFIDHASIELTSGPISQSAGILNFLETRPAEIYELTGHTPGALEYRALVSTATGQVEALMKTLGQMRTRLEKMRDGMRNA